jgi:hypothetical protein
MPGLYQISFALAFVMLNQIYHMEMHNYISIPKRWTEI